MLFNSIPYISFVFAVFFFYWHLKKADSRNVLILSASIFFYGCWDWRFIPLILVNAIFDYNCALKIEMSEDKKKWLVLSIVSNLGMLAFFKYYNFFIDAINEVANTIGKDPIYNSLNIILPVGISFYTFQTMSYTIDVYNKKIPACKNVVRYMTYVTFFPQLVAGPIERASKLLPQFREKKNFSYTLATSGLKLMLLGYFKKIVIADTLAKYVDDIFVNFKDLPTNILVVGLILFGMQIYCDFSGYSDIARGTARLFGINLRLNFRQPYFSVSVKSFWKNWHISLSSWFSDYVYIPLGGNKVNKFRSLANTMVVFALSGLWHGANWTFVFWGVYNGFLLIMYKIIKKYIPQYKFLQFPSVLLTYCCITVGWLLFRSDNIQVATAYFKRMLSMDTFKFPSMYRVALLYVFIALASDLFLHIKMWDYMKKIKFFRWCTYVSITFVIFAHFSVNKTFVYFQF
jgi:D-alanyl-lipoteichoic acid acyltransferase DltB (MBOAT superfamily)